MITKLTRSYRSESSIISFASAFPLFRCKRSRKEAWLKLWIIESLLTKLWYQNFKFVTVSPHLQCHTLQAAQLKTRLSVSSQRKITWKLSWPISLFYFERIKFRENWSDTSWNWYYSVFANEKSFASRYNHMLTSIKCWLPDACELVFYAFE